MDDKIRTALCAPFPADAVKNRRGSFGKPISFVETHNVIARLNDCFESDWSFRILSHEVLSTGEVLVHARLEVLGLCKEAFGRATPAISKDTGEVLSLGDTVKAACSDALKKAATLLGVGGAALYSDDMPEPSEEKPTRTKPAEPARNDPPAPANRASSKQVAAVWSIGRKLGLNANEIRQRCMAEYGAFPEQLDRSAASRFIGELADQVDGQKGAA